jgi:menaquinone-dependent protoporphyrinogen oxidase
MRVLVAYESKHGSTQAIAERISATLASHHHETLVRSIAEISAPAGYDAYVIGSAVYYGGWTKGAVAFVREHEDAFRGKPVWLFSSGPVGKSQPADPKEMDLLRQTTKPRDHHVFYGALDRAKLSIGERLVVGAVKAPDGDYRDWEDVERWAESIASEIAQPVPVIA